jgi:2-polyprenyl-3-methyl-5-hydroxy-6-metoxy-1,4-benzoquinol methylase
MTLAERNSEADCLGTMAPLVAEFFDLSISEAYERLSHEYENPGSLVAQAWQEANPNTPEEVQRFYEETDSYVFDLAADNCRERRRPVWQVVLGRLRHAPGTNVLAYGDGIGTDSVRLARFGYRVTYFDLPGVTSQFARRRFEREGLDDQIVFADRVDDLPIGRFDAIVCIEVLEHLSDPVEAMRRFHALLRENGVILLTESFESVGPDYPSHLESNQRYAGRTHKIMESIGFANTFINLDPINRPMEFRKVPPTLSSNVLRLKGRTKRALLTRLGNLRRAAARHT